MRATAALFEPYFAYHAARDLGAELAWPDRYRRAVLAGGER